MSKEKSLLVFEQDLVSAVRFGFEEAFHLALANAITAWPDPRQLQPGEWERLKSRLVHLASALMNASPAAVAPSLVDSMYFQEALAARCLAACCFAHLQKPSHHPSLEDMARDHIMVQSCLAGALRTHPEEERRMLSNVWIDDPEPRMQALAVRIFPASPPSEGMAFIQALRPVQHAALQEAIIDFCVRTAEIDLNLVFATLNRWSSAPLPGDGFMITRTLTLQPLRSQFEACFQTLSILAEHADAIAEGDQRILTALRALEREHGSGALHKQLSMWEASPSSVKKALSEKARRRLKQGID